MKLKKIALTISASLLVLVGAVTFLPLRAIAGLETPCNYISDLVATNPLSSDLASTGDDHLRCIKSVLKTTFPNVNGAVSSTDEQLSQINTGIFTVTPFEHENAAWRILFDETDATTNERLYDFAGSAGQFLGRTRTDADAAGATWLTVDRTGTTVDSIALAATSITLNSVASSDFARLSTSNVPTSSNAYDLGSSSSKWRVVYANDYSDGSVATGQLVGTTSTTAIFSGGSTWSAGSLRTAGAERLGYSSSAVTTSVPVRTSDGSASAPAHSFSGGTNTGMYRESNVISFASAGTRVAQLDGNAFEVAGTAIALDNDGTRVLIITGSGSPEGVQVANVGSLYLRNDSSTTLYVKQTGSGNTGWVAK